MAMARTEEPRERFRGRLGLFTTLPSRKDPSPNKPDETSKAGIVVAVEAAVVAEVNVVRVLIVGGSSDNNDDKEWVDE